MDFIKTYPQYLQREVKFFYSIKYSNTQHYGAYHRRLPDGTLDIVFNLSKAVHISRNGKDFFRMPNVALTGLFTDKSFLQYDDEIHLAGVVLQPGFAHLFLNDSLAWFKAGTEDASLIFGNHINSLCEQLYTVEDEKEKHRLLEKFLMLHLKKTGNDCNLNRIENSVAKIQQSNGNILIRDLCKYYFMSERNFRRKFIEYVGITPKKYAGIIRIKSLCRSYVSNKSSYAAIRNEAAYFDQSHLLKEFNKIVGTNPEFYFNNMNIISEKFLQLM